MLAPRLPAPMSVGAPIKETRVFMARIVAALRVSMLLVCPAAAPESTAYSRPRPVTLVGYDDDAMEPFLTRDGRVLLFNNSNDPAAQTDLHWAERINDTTFAWRGRVQGVNTDALEGVPSTDNQSQLYFVSPREYASKRATVPEADCTAVAWSHCSACQPHHTGWRRSTPVPWSTPPAGRTTGARCCSRAPATRPTAAPHRSGSRAARPPTSHSNRPCACRGSMASWRRRHCHPTSSCCTTTGAMANVGGSTWPSAERQAPVSDRSAWNASLHS